jgi:hypothetical protein
MAKYLGLHDWKKDIRNKFLALVTSCFGVKNSLPKKSWEGGILKKNPNYFEK